MEFDFGYRLRNLRESKKLTQTQVAKRLNLSKTSISGYENNIKTPSLEVLSRLAILYGVPTDYILGLDNRKMLLVEGLNPRHVELITKLVAELKQK